MTTRPPDTAKISTTPYTTSTTASSSTRPTAATRGRGAWVCLVPPRSGAGSDPGSGGVELTRTDSMQPERSRSGAEGLDRRQPEKAPPVTPTVIGQVIPMGAARLDHDQLVDSRFLFR